MESGALIHRRGRPSGAFLILENPGIEGRIQAPTRCSPASRMIIPGEVAYAHRHGLPRQSASCSTGGGLYRVEGEKAYMSPGDFGHHRKLAPAGPRQPPSQKPRLWRWETRARLRRSSCGRVFDKPCVAPADDRGLEFVAQRLSPALTTELCSYGVGFRYSVCRRLSDQFSDSRIRVEGCPGEARLVDRDEAVSRSTQAPGSADRGRDKVFTLLASATVAASSSSYWRRDGPAPRIFLAQRRDFADHRVGRRSGRQICSAMRDRARFDLSA